MCFGAPYPHVKILNNREICTGFGIFMCVPENRLLFARRDQKIDNNNNNNNNNNNKKFKTKTSN